MLATVRGANCGASSMITRPLANCRYSVFCGSSACQSDGLDADKTSPMVGGLGLSAADAATGKQAARQAAVTLKALIARSPAAGGRACRVPCDSRPVPGR